MKKLICPSCRKPIILKNYIAFFCNKLSSCSNCNEKFFFGHDVKIRWVLFFGNVVASAFSIYNFKNGNYQKAVISFLILSILIYLWFYLGKVFIKK